MGDTSAPGFSKREEGVKRRKYQHLALVPCIMSHTGRFGKAFKSWLGSVNCDPDVGLRSAKISDCYQTLSSVLQKYNVALLSTAGTMIGDA